MSEDWGYRDPNDVIDKLLAVDSKFILDVGCGEGALCRHLAKSGANVLGIEPHPEIAAINNRAPVTTNVGFVQAGAAELPVESNSVDGMLFSKSLHHIYAPEFEKVFDEIKRVLKNTGFLYVAEPVAAGSFHHVMAPFHDETQVRLEAYRALEKYAHPSFGDMREIYYDVEATYASFDEYVQNFEDKRFNQYTAPVRSAEVQSRFEECKNSHGSFTLSQPVRVNYYTQLNH